VKGEEGSEKKESGEVMRYTTFGEGKKLYLQF
jgi:hypothetical protein